jgi:hypothetical protein
MWPPNSAYNFTRERQLLIDFLCARSCGPPNNVDANIGNHPSKMFLRHAAASVAGLQISETEQYDLAAFVQSLRKAPTYRPGMD